MRNLRRELFEWFIAAVIVFGILFIISLFITHGVTRNQEETIPAENFGSVNVYLPGGETHGYYGEIKIINDGSDGNMIEIELDGHLVGSGMVEGDRK